MLFGSKIPRISRPKTLVLSTSICALLTPQLAADEVTLTSPPAENATRLTMTGSDALALASRLFEQGELDQAEVILRSLVTSDPDKVDHMQVAFVTAMIASKRGDYRDAIEIFRQILDVDPSLVSVRLELAANLFQVKDDRAAAYHFKLAMESDLPEPTKAIIVGFLQKIEARRFWRYGFEISVAPSTNISSGSAEEQIFLNIGQGDTAQQVEVTEFRRETSGIGLSTSLSAGYTPHISGRLWGEARAALYLTDYGNEKFDSAYEYIEAGPSFRGKALQVSVLANMAKRQYGNDHMSSSHGSRLILRTPLSSRMGVSFRLGITDTDYDISDNRDGKTYAYGLTLSRAFGSRTFGAIDVNISNDRAQDQVERNMTYGISASLSREFGSGITIRVTPQYIYRDYHVRSDLLGVERLDQGAGLGVKITKRDWRIRGFAPVFGYQYFSNISSNPLHEFDRHSFEFGLTRNF